MTIQDVGQIWVYGLASVIGWMGVVFLLSAVYVACDYGLSVVIRKEGVKRLTVIKPLFEFATGKKYEEVKPIARRIEYNIAVSKKTKKERDMIIEKGKKLIKEKNDSPFLYVSSFLIKLLLFFWFLYSFQSLEVIAAEPYYSYVVIGLMLIGGLNKKNIVLMGLLSALAFWFYQYFSGAALLYLGMIMAFRVIMRFKPSRVEQ